jgi:hypothetical protein
MRKKNDRVISPLAIPKSCDTFFFERINAGCQATHTPEKKKKEEKKKEKKEKEKRRKYFYVLINFLFREFMDLMLILSLQLISSFMLP